LISAVIADTGGLLRALARTPEGKASFPDYRNLSLTLLASEHAVERSAHHFYQAHGARAGGCDRIWTTPQQEAKITHAEVRH
jgi:hypothetical protein